MATKPVIFQGTFDPFTNGHLAVLKTALDLFGQVRVLLLINPDKKPLFSVQEREEMIKQIAADLPGVSVDHFDGLLVDYMRAHNLTTCVRGVRNEQDAAYELHNAHLSQQLYPDLCTLFIPAETAFVPVSSSAAKIAYQNQTLPLNWLPEGVQQRLAKKFFS